MGSNWEQQAFPKVGRSISKPFAFSVMLMLIVNDYKTTHEAPR